MTIARSNAKRPNTHAFHDDHKVSLCRRIGREFCGPEVALAEHEIASLTTCNTCRKRLGG
jgi:hypothetical protein